MKILKLSDLEILSQCIASLPIEFPVNAKITVEFNAIEHNDIIKELKGIMGEATTNLINKSDSFIYNTINGIRFEIKQEKGLKEISETLVDFGADSGQVEMGNHLKEMFDEPKENLYVKQLEQKYQTLESILTHIKSILEDTKGQNLYRLVEDVNEALENI